MPGHVPGFGVLRAIGPARPNRGGETLRRSGRISHAPCDEAKALLRHHIGPAHETLMSLMLRMTHRGRQHLANVTVGRYSPK